MYYSITFVILRHTFTIDHVDFLRTMIHYDPVVEIVKSKTGREYCNGEIVQFSGVLEDHADPVLDSGPLRVDLVLLLVQLERDDGEDDGVLDDCAEYHEDASHNERVDGVEFREPRRGSVGTDAIEDVDQNKK